MPPESITVEGGLFPPDLLQRLAQGEAAPDQRPQDFHLPKSAGLADETQTAFSDIRSFHDAWQRRADPDAVAREAFVEPLLERLGFGNLHFQRANIEIGGASFDVHRRTHDAEDAAPIHIVRADADLDRRGERRRSPAAELQDLLNRSEALWGILANGPLIRILRDSAGRSRPAWLQFDLEAIINDNAYADFVLLYRLLHRSRFPWPEKPAHQCPLERLYQQGVEEGGRVRDKLRDGVKQALETLGGALLQRENNRQLRQALQDGELDAPAFYRQLLNFVYRLLFLMVAEERKLLAGPNADPNADPAKYAVFAQHYGIARLRQRADRHANQADDYADLWIGLRQTFRVCRDEDAARIVGLSPLNGQLFGEDSCYHLEAAECPNDALLQAIGHLSNYRAEDQRLRRVNYAHLDVEELGSVYESLLDYAPRISPDHRAFHLAAGSERKQTGSYYTPPELVRELVDSALVPVMQERLDAARTPAAKEQALLDLRVCDPAAGSGHFLLAAARRIGDQLAEIRAAPAEPDDQERRNARRDVVQQCIYAVDKNPLAVDLCKVALWIEAHAAGLPLSFLDHHVKHGDSLVGVLHLDALEQGIPDGAYNPVAGDQKPAASSYKKQNREERKGQLPLDFAPAETAGLAAEFTALGKQPQRSAEDVRQIERRYNAARSQGTDWWTQKTACDLWTYAFFAPLTERPQHQPDQVPTTADIYNALSGRARGDLIGAAAQASQQHPYFHWPLEFPDVQDNGGFDVVLGNPPWEQLQPEELKFFDAHDSHIARLPGAARKAAIDQLRDTNPELARLWQAHQRDIAHVSGFARESGRFALTSYRKINTSSIFAECATQLIHSNGRTGLIVPSAIATGDATKRFFAALMDGETLVSLFDFENRQKVFPGIDGRIKFSLLTISGSRHTMPTAAFAFFLHRADQLHDPKRNIPLTTADIALFNPNTRTCPIFRSRRDYAIASKMYKRAGIFCWEGDTDDHALNPWGASLSQMFNMTSASGSFRRPEDLEADGFVLENNEFVHGDERFMPLYEGKMFHQFDHRFATYADTPLGNPKGRKPRDVRDDEKREWSMTALPRYWLPLQTVLDRLHELRSSGAAADRERRRIGSGGGSGAAADRERRRIGSGELRSPLSRRWRAVRSPAFRSSHRQENDDDRDPANSRLRRFFDPDSIWQLAFRDITNPTNQRTALSTILGCVAMNNKAPTILMDGGRWLQVFRDIGRATDSRTFVTTNIPLTAANHKAPILRYADAEAVASALVMSNMNSIPLDWAARLAVGDVNMSFFIVKQLPILPPEAYIEVSPPGPAWVELVVPRVLELTYTAWDLQPFAEDLGYEGEPFVWDEERRHKLKSELDAIYAHMYGLDRDEIEWILEPEEPSVSFPALQRSEEKEYGEYRTKRYVLHAYDQLARSELPDLSGIPADIRS